MSHSTGALKFNDGTIRYYEYDGTADVVISHHYATIEEVSENWRKGEWLKCNCENEEPVNIFTTYGGGFYIDGFACKICNSVHSKTIDEYGNFQIIMRNKQEDWANTILGW